MNRLSVSPKIQQAVQRDYERFAESGLPASLEGYLLDEYGLDVSAEYAGFALKNPWGKASGQLSMTARQVEEDVAAGLGFVVLKSVIAQNECGEQSMSAWAIPEARMVTERIVGQSGEAGWTITWKGRGWWQSLEAYLQLIRDARRLAEGTGTLIVPSCKYHLPSPDELEWRVGEYEYTTRRMLLAFDDRFVGRIGNPPYAQDVVVMPLEKDFSPTLAGSDRAGTQAKILEWLRVVPKLVREAALRSRHAPRDEPNGQTTSSEHSAHHAERDGYVEASSELGGVRIGLKMFNALLDDEFQIEMLKAIHAAGADRPDFFVYANRLFDPQREFEGHRGVAFGGPDLSDRNLRVLDRFREAVDSGQVTMPLLPWSATGNITTGRMAVEYALRGATSFQLHTFFQLPADQYAMKVGNRTQRALHELYFHPQTGLIVWLFDAAHRLGLSREPLRFRDVACAS